MIPSAPHWWGKAWELKQVFVTIWFVALQETHIFLMSWLSPAYQLNALGKLCSLFPIPQEQFSTLKRQFIQISKCWHGKQRLSAISQHCLLVAGERLSHQDYMAHYQCDI